MDADVILVDTNVLVSASVGIRSLHKAATDVMNEWPNRGKRLCTSGQVLREYLVVATRPAERNGLGFDSTKALENVSAFQERMYFLEESEVVAKRLQTLLRETPCHGKQVHDANLVATALVNKVDSIVTANVNDFKRFETYLNILDLTH